MRCSPIIFLFFIIACTNKNDNLDGPVEKLDAVKIYNGYDYNWQTDTVLVFKTDTSTIKIYIVGGIKHIEEFYNNKDLVRHVDYFSNNKTIREQYYWNKAGTEEVGVHKSFNRDGKLKLMIDFENRTWKRGNTRQFPHYKLLIDMKSKADSILASMYSQNFIDNHLKWSMFNSDYFDKTYSQPSFTISWFEEDSYKYKPSEFIVSYDLIVENTPIEKFVRIIFDRKGRILKSHNWNDLSEVYNIGLIDNKAKSRVDLVMSPNLALDYVKKQNPDIDIKKLSTSFEWIPNVGHESSIYNGKWEINVLQHLYSQNCNSNGSNCKREYYCVYIFNPWSGKFLHRKKMYKEITYGSDWSNTTGFIDAN